ncbi:50S ribosomal protein L21, chloroplastic-like isoform X2 [Juglans microcarpa x Juglans regia]|uniref:50S ribosomal protein L21, chloroplastic-like isoform X2 n=1 Tax=Juglans microcarpa x Juglans regia TaxID=2249226 RepID=UPI001B7F5412|nr:50S ribosomal protein L21, chloroplastic-like isoform X2 [Juglans microcarpa x Juglans regia]
MASATLSLCPSFPTHCRISTKQYPSPTFSFSFSNNSNLRSLSLSSLNLSLSSSSRTFPLLSKFSESEAAVLESESGSPEPEAAEFVQTSPVQVPKREEVFAVVMIGSRQYIVFPGRFIYTQRLKGANVNDKIILNKVLLIGTRTSTYIGKPVVTNAAVHAVVEEQGLDPKVIVFKYKKKKNYRRNIGHRQPNTRIRITGITGYQDYPAVTLES